MNTMIKVATALPALALISACSTTAPHTTTGSQTMVDSNATVAYDRMSPAPYMCSDNSKVLAKQSINKQQAMITATVPKINWTQQSLILNGDVNGDTASYVNDSNPEITYAWHMTGDKGILAMKWANGKTYQVNCQL